MLATAKDYENVEVIKPWGFEYLMYCNEQAALWYLHLKPGESTSLHCHPRKKTGLVLLAGEAEVSFLNDSTRLRALSRLMIRPGLFHSTKALSKEGIVLLEIETPRDKENLVRLEDSYGRKNKPYENGPNIKPLGEDRLVLHTPPEEAQEHFDLAGCRLSLLRTRNIESITDLHHDDIMMVLEGGLYSRVGEPILTTGDVVSPDTWHRLAPHFDAHKGITLLIINCQ